MSQSQFMRLKILLPFKVLAEESKVARLVVETIHGSFGFLPHRLDCVAALVPGILTYQCEGQSEVFLAVDQGIFVKSGMDVLVSVRKAVAGSDLSQLRQTVEREFVNIGAQEQSLRTAMAKMESGFVHRLSEFQNER